MGRKAVTLSDVARHAGVSPTTASYIINGRSAQMRISADAERRVREAVRHLGYRPNRSARSLRTATTKTIGVISDFVTSGATATAMLVGAGAAARASGRLLLVGETEGDAETERLLIEEMLARRVDGIVYVRGVTGAVSLPHPLAEERVVLLNCVDPDSKAPAVLPDEREGGRAAAELLLDAGVAHNAYVVGGDEALGVAAGGLRLEGVRTRLREGGHPLAGEVACHLSARAAHDAVHRWLMGGVRPSALICLDERVAPGVYQALATHGLDVPHDVSVVSLGDSDLAAALRPSLSSIGVPYVDMGSIAVEKLIGSRGQGGGVVLVPMNLAVRESTGPSRRIPTGERAREQRTKSSGVSDH